MPQQDFKNHGRIVPIFHIGVFFPFAANFLWRAYQLTQGITGEIVMEFIMAIALLLFATSVRRQVITVQDRVIRLEMRLRLARLLPPNLHRDIDTLTVPQLVALRFASDGELPELTREVLAGRLASQKEIKMKVKKWEADYQRA